MTYTLEPIFESDWLAYEWFEVTSLSDENPIYKRGKRRVPPPADGYHYVRSDKYNDSEYRWCRVYEAVNK